MADIGQILFTVVFFRRRKFVNRLPQRQASLGEEAELSFKIGPTVFD